MNEEIRAAIGERIELGYTKEDIVQELQAAGYPATMADDLYEAAVSGAAAQEIPDTVFPTASTVAPPDQSPAAPEEHEPENATTVPQQPSVIAYEVTQHHHKPLNRNNLLVLGFLFVLLMVAVAAGVYAAKGTDVLQKIGLLGGGAPYASEAEMLEGVFSHFQSLTAHGFNLDYEVALEPKDPNALTLSKDLFTEEELEDLADEFTYAPSEGIVKFTASGLVDARDTSNPELDISLQLNVLAEPFIINAAASILVDNGTLYGRIDKFPANFRQFLYGVPENEWIILQSGLEFDAWPSTHPLAPIGGIQAYRDFTPAIVQLYADEVLRLMTLGRQGVTEMAQETSRQMASGITALGLDTSMGPQERQMLEQSLALLQQYPIFRFTGEPEQVKVNNEVLYRYNVDIDYENMRKYFSSLVQEAESITGQSMSLSATEMDSLLPKREVVDEINRLTDIVFAFRSDGGLAEMSLNGVLAFDHPEITSQARVSMSIAYTKQNDGMSITAPAEVHPKTLEEIMEEYTARVSTGECVGDPMCESIHEARVAGSDASIKQSLSSIRILAELSYNRNNYQYGEVCADEQVQQYLYSIAGYLGGVPNTERDGISGPGKIVCNDTSQSYAIIVPLASNENISWCVDSTGFFDEVSPDVLSTGGDTSCQ